MDYLERGSLFCGASELFGSGSSCFFFNFFKIKKGNIHMGNVFQIKK